MTQQPYSRSLHHYETDADGVCHFSNYLRIFEEAFEFSLAEAGFPISELEHTFAVFNLQVDYLRPLRPNITFNVIIDFLRIKRSFIHAKALIYAAESHCASLKITLVATNRKDNSSTQIASTLRKKLLTLQVASS